MLGEPFLRTITGDSVEPNDLVGIYLPLLWPEGACIPMPIVVAFLMDHFLPLRCRAPSSTEKTSDVYAVPLVTSSLEPLRVHFLLPDEENGAHLLLQRYLELVELSVSEERGCDGVLAARTVSDEAAVESFYRQRKALTMRGMLFGRLDFYPKCSVENCGFTSIGDAGGMCFVCSSMGRLPYQALVDVSWRGWFDGATLPRCANVDCENESWLPCGGLCRLCSIGCLPRHYDLRVSTFMNEFAQQFTRFGTQNDRKAL